MIVCLTVLRMDMISTNSVRIKLKDLMQKWPYMPPSFTHEVNSLDITFDHTFRKSMVCGFLTFTLHRCEWCITQVVSTNDKVTETGFILSKYCISIFIFCLGFVSCYLFIQSIRIWVTEVETTVFKCYSKTILLWGPFFAVLSMVKF